MKNLINIQNINLKKGTLLFLLLTCLTYTTLAQTDHTLQGSDVTIDGNGMITACSCTFKSNTKGTNLTIPKSVTKGSETIIIKAIGSSIFQDKNLVSVAFDSDSEVTTIGESAFRRGYTGDNKKITKLTLPTTLTTIGANAFRNNLIETLTLPTTLTTIGWAAFLLNSITELILPPTLTTIGGSAFQANSLTRVVFNVDLNKSQIKSIGSNAFSINTGLASIILPQHAGGDDITYKDSNNQEYDPNIVDKNTFTNFDRSLVAVLPAHPLTADDVEVVDGIITKCYCNFLSNSITIPEKIDGETITGIGSNAFKEKSLVAGAFAAESKITSIGSFAFGNNLIGTLTLPTTVTTIGSNAFRNNLIGTLTLPTTVTTIGDWAFANNNITTSHFPENSQLKTIGSNAFRNNLIGTLTLPTTVTTIGRSAFYNNKITTLTFPDDLTTIGASAFQDNQIATLTFPDDLTTIGASAFQENQLTEVKFVDNQNDKSMIRSIGINAFKDNSALTTITLPLNGNNNFDGYRDSNGGKHDEAAQITDFTLGYNAFIPYELTAPKDIDVNGFGIITRCYCDKFTSRDITIPASITEDGISVNIVGIRYNVFFDKQLTSVVLPEGLISIGISAFGYNSLAPLTLPRSVKYIGSRAFYNNNLTAVTFAGDDNNKANIISIGHEAFGENTGLTSINLPSNTRATDDNFSYKDGAGTEYAQGAEFKDFDRSLYVDIPYILTVNDIKVDVNGVITECNCDKFDSRTITIPTTIEKSGSNVTITGIGRDVFQNETLATVSFEAGSQITAIGSFAFLDNSITTLTLPTTLTTIGQSAFLNNPLESFTLPLATKEGFRTYWQDGDSKDLGTNLTINQADFAKSFKLVSIEQVTLTLTIDETGASSEVSGLNAGENKIDKGVDFELKAMPASGQRFVSWTIGVETIVNNPYTLPATATEADIDITVTFEAIPQQVTLTLAIEGEGSINPLVKPNSVDPDNEMKGMYDINTDVELTAEPNPNWRFDKWVITSGEDENGNPITETFDVVGVDVKVDADKTATAHFVEQVTLTLAIQGLGQVQGLEAGENPIDKGQEFTITATPNEGHEFEKWVFEGANISTSTYTIPADKTQDKLSIDIEVHFKEKDFLNPVKLTINIDGQGTVTPNTGINTYERGSGVDLTATPDEGWRFDKWVISDEQDKTDETTTITLDANKTATAYFVQQFTLTTAVAEQQGGTIAPLIDPNGKVYDINTKVELTATPNDGWRFDRWVISDEENETDKTTTITLDKNKTATAHFVEQVTLTLIIEETEASGEVSGLSAGKNKIDKGADFELKATPASGQKFVSWTIDGKTIDYNPHTLTTTEADIGITVTFEAIPLDNQVTLTLDIVGEGSTTPDKGENIYKKDKDVELTATPDEGWKFDKWVIGTDEITENPTTITLNQDKTVTAHFVQLVTLTTSVEGQQGGTISTTPKPSLEDNQYDINTKVTLTAKPDEGWKFDKWVIGTDEITENPTTITLDQDKTVTAHFVEGEEAITSILTEVVSATPYPNPVTSQITLKAKDGDLIQLFSQKGKQQYSTQHTGNEVHIIDVSTIPVGVYLVRITDAEGNTTTKRILKK